jgi:hypothetical protein
VGAANTSNEKTSQYEENTFFIGSKITNEFVLLKHGLSKGLLIFAAGIGAGGSKIFTGMELRR